MPSYLGGMDSHAAPQNTSVSNLVASFEDDGGGSFEPAAAATVVEQVVHAEAIARPEIRPETRLVTPPERFDAGEPVERPSAFSYAALPEGEATWAERRTAAITEVLLDPERDDEGLPVVDYHALHRRDIAKQLLRARLVAIAEQREHRTAYEIAFIMLAAAVAILLAAPPLVQVLLAAHGVQG